jgi:hypothetical protein
MISDQVTCTVSTRNRYNTTLPLTLFGIAQQSVLPRHLIIYDDGDHKDLRKDPTYVSLFHLLSARGIKWLVLFGSGKGQVNNHQHALYTSQTPWVWRVDDDEVPEPNTLSTLLRYVADGIGAISCFIPQPGDIVSYSVSSTSIDTVSSLPHVQWSRVEHIVEAEHLYSSFLYRRDAAYHGYCRDLSPVGHREETLFTYEMHLKGWKLLVVPGTSVWHLRSPSGGIREGYEKECWEHDEAVFQQRLRELETQYKKDEFYVVLDSGIGDHFVLKTLLPEIRQKHRYKKIVVAACYPKVFEDDKDVELISLAEARQRLGNLDPFSLYGLGMKTYHRGHVVDIYRKLYS